MSVTIRLLCCSARLVRFRSIICHSQSLWKVTFSCHINNILPLLSNIMLLCLSNWWQKKERTQTTTNSPSKAPKLSLLFVSAPASDRSWHGRFLSQKARCVKAWFRAVWSSCHSLAAVLSAPVTPHLTCMCAMCLCMSWLSIWDRQVLTAVCWLA